MGLKPVGIRPFVTLVRLFYALQVVLRLGERNIVGNRPAGFEPTLHRRETRVIGADDLIVIGELPLKHT